MDFRVFVGQAERLGGDIDQYSLSAVVGEGQGDCNADHATPGSHIEHAGGSGKFQLESLFDQFLGLGTRDQGPLVRSKFPSAELHRSEEVLEWFTHPAGLEEFSQGNEFILGHRTVELGVELNATTSDLVGYQPLHVAPGTIDAPVLKVGSSTFEAVQDGLHEMAAALFLLFRFQAGFSETLGHLRFLQLFGELFHCPREDALQVMGRIVDTVVSDAGLLEIIGPYLLGAITRSDQGAALGRVFLLLFVLFGFK